MITVDSDKNVVLLHSAGTGGDLLSSYWINSGRFYSAVQTHSLTSYGRMFPVWNAEFLNQFPKQPKKHYYNRDWTKDLAQLEKLKQPFFINTTDCAQAELIKNWFGEKVCVISVSYNENLWPLVVKNFCTKVLDSPNYLTRDDVGEAFLQAVAKTPEEQEKFLELGNSYELGYWYATNLLHGCINFPPKEFVYSGDINILLDEILIKDRLINILKSTQFTIDTDIFVNIYDNWCKTQDQIYFYSYDNAEFNNCLGYNRLSNNPPDNPILLSKFDQLFIKKYTNTDNQYNNTSELLDFLKVDQK